MQVSSSYYFLYIIYYSIYTNDTIIPHLITEWPMYEHGNQHNLRRTHGNVNILQFGSNVTQYTLIIELYNFTNNATQMSAIGQKLKAIFSLEGVACFTGCKQKNDYDKLVNQYPIFGLTKDRAIMSKMDDVSLMALNRGITSKGKGKTTLQALCRGQNLLLKKENHI